MPSGSLCSTTSKAAAAATSVPPRSGDAARPDAYSCSTAKTSPAAGSGDAGSGANVGQHRPVVLPSPAGQSSRDLGASPARL
ncbi:hypothetical protein [Massilia sp. TWR1-2-2]|uniref:hypothetical protein n=1 Tax=Massilia sp. TWR1-2-2 TaxID=2804584 RepID=UPI003CE69A18